MTTIWKCPLEITDTQIIKLPIGHKIISVQFQNDILCLWAIVDPNAITQEIEIIIIGTGNPFRYPNTCKFIATVQEPRLVWHIFEKIN